MTISHVSSHLYKPAGADDDAKIPEWMLEYARQRSQQEMHSLALSEFRKSGISQATLKRRLGKRADVISRNMKAPGNWTASTFAELIFAISGKIPQYAAVYAEDADNAQASSGFKLVVTARPMPRENESVKGLFFSRSVGDFDDRYQHQAIIRGAHGPTLTGTTSIGSNRD